MTSAPTDPGCDYNPAVAALINRLKDKLKGSCLPRPLTVQSDGTVPCNVVEVVGNHAADCDGYCASQGRNVTGPASPLMTAAVQSQMTQSGICGNSDQPACSSMCLCSLNQESGTADTNDNPGGATDLSVCQKSNDGSQNSLPPGYCYVDPGANPPADNDPEIVAKCPPTQQRILRFVGNNPTSGGVAVPLAGSYVFIACEGAALQSQ